MIQLNATAPHRFSAMVATPDANGCTLWTGAITPNGYGVFSTNGRRSQQYAHRVAFEMAGGELLPGQVVDHLCRVPSCVNPLHLEAVTQRENVRRGICSAVQTARHAARTHCKNGHEFTPENTGTRSDGHGRRCRACNRISKQERR